MNFIICNDVPELLFFSTESLTTSSALSFISKDSYAAVILKTELECKGDLGLLKYSSSKGSASLTLPSPANAIPRQNFSSSPFTASMAS